MNAPIVAGSTLAMFLFAGLALWQAERWRDRATRALIAACVAMALWCLATAVAGIDAPVSQLSESVRNFAWLVFLHVLLRRGGIEYRSLRALYAVLAFVATANGVIDLLNAIDPTREAPIAALLVSAFALRMVFAVGALVAVHNLYTATAAGARAGVGLPLAALGLLWGIDLTFYALCWAQADWVIEFAAVRVLVVVAVAPMIALSVRRNTEWTIRLSRTVAFRSIGLVGALLYLGVVIGSAYVLQAYAGPWATLVPPTILMLSALGAAIAMSSRRIRAWTTVMLSKHLFAHRYDYRAEWLRFTGTLGVPGLGAAPLDVRVVKAIADIVHAPGGLLLTPNGDALSASSRWQWAALIPPLDGGGAQLAKRLAKGRIIELDALRGDRGDPAEAADIPEWIIGDPATYAIVPLIHVDRLTGAVLLERPLAPRALDWEDFDLLRLAGRQVASYLAEASAQDALGDAERFDEFNRRFAFIMHDIKNLVSQLTLVTRNAERHADNPEFRADMIATLQSSTARMNDLLARLSQHNTSRAEEPRAIDVHGTAAALAAEGRKRHPVVLAGEGAAFAIADPTRLNQAASHLVHNAIDASPPTEPVTISIVHRDDEIGLEVADLGVGMTAEFVANTLFKPFSSTKSGGFGIGAYEARELVAAMGGRIAVITGPSEGTRVTIWLRRAESHRVRRAA